MTGEGRSPRAAVRHAVGRVLPAPVRKRVREGLDGARAAKRRRALLAADPGLRAAEGPHGAVIGRIAEDFTAAGAAEANLRLVVAAAEAAGLEYFLVPGHSPVRHVVGLRKADKKAFLESMRERYGDGDVYAARFSGERCTARGMYAEGALPTAVKNAQTIRFARIGLGPQGQVLAGLDYGCDVEFWRDGEEFAAQPDFDRKLDRVRVRIPAAMFAGAWVGPRPNRVADVLPAEARVPAHREVGGREYPTFEPFTRKLADDVDFPVDAVYMWVDGDDPAWAAERARYLGGDAAEHAHLGGASRYTSRDELKYSLRSLHAFAPFIRHVYIVTAGQTPDWLDTGHDGVTVVDHAEIFADPSALPVFSSHAIATQLHHIEGLSDHYLVLNDDLFFGQPSQAERFFHANGIAQLPFSPLQIGLGAVRPEDSAPNSAGKNVRALLEPDFGRFITRKFKHIPHPQLRPVLYELEKRYADAVDATSRSRFRDPRDIEFAAMLHHHYAMLTGRAVPGRSKLHYVDIYDPAAPERLAGILAARDGEFFCLNEVEPVPEREAEVRAMVRGFLEAYFPFPSPYERS
ncbi:stealth family protein [Glycomyces albidus]|uniref:Sugar phosphotransferase n=1 Tax=Glycomyces albidus TaxID=2656774 RepID=A0A6L5GFR6_9ACTN|nr:stealth family protein [Glycomyces albidus]MQM28426.1 sugar phosphotransferase [Glycomyces albidus]